MINQSYMQTAITEAKKGLGWTHPNPLVGAVIVKEGEIIGIGYHEVYGGPHAERNALSHCTKNPEEGTMYITLEPCCHYGKTPPCTDAIIEHKLSTVIIGSKDPNPLVSGKGIQLLKQSGIHVVTGIMEKECDEINSVFFHYIRTRTPYVVMKYAMTADGKTASFTGQSKWITEEKTREQVHFSRHQYTAIMTGLGTVLADDPMLNCRIPGCSSPIRIICDTHLRTPLDSNIVKTACEQPVFIATSCTDVQRQKLYSEKGCSILCIPRKNGHVDLNILMKELASRHIDSILLEGGAELNYSALEAGIVTKIQAYIAPKVLGGAFAKTAVGGQGIESPEDAIILTNQKITTLGNDILIEWDVKKNVYRDH